MMKGLKVDDMQQELMLAEPFNTYRKINERENTEGLECQNGRARKGLNFMQRLAGEQMWS